LIKYFHQQELYLIKTAAKDRQKLLNEINDLLLSGDPKLDDLGVATFGKLDETKKAALVKKLKDLKVDDEVTTDILGSLSAIRSRWSDLFSKLGRSLGKMKYKNLKNYLVINLKIILGLHMTYFKTKVSFHGQDTNHTRSNRRS
jgi:hypothetical protein